MRWEQTQVGQAESLIPVSWGLNSEACSTNYLAPEAEGIVAPLVDFWEYWRWLAGLYLFVVMALDSSEPMFSALSAWVWVKIAVNSRHTSQAAAASSCI
jgi:hypothetical protein